MLTNTHTKQGVKAYTPMMPHTFTRTIHSHTSHTHAKHTLTHTTHTIHSHTLTHSHTPYTHTHHTPYTHTHHTLTHTHSIYKV